MTSKPALRAHLRALRDVAPPHAIPVPPALADRLMPDTVVATYVAIGGEADPAPLTAAARAAGCRIALPHVTGREAPLAFLAWDDATPLVAGPFGLRQPPADAPPLRPDIILAPLVGFDRRGGRLGQGAGHYDRAFATHPSAWRIGVALAIQEIDTVPTDPWDMPLHAVSTEREWIVVA